MARLVTSENPFGLTVSNSFNIHALKSTKEKKFSFKVLRHRSKNKVLLSILLHFENLIQTSFESARCLKPTAPSIFEVIFLKKRCDGH